MTCPAILSLKKQQNHMVHNWETSLLIQPRSSLCVFFPAGLLHIYVCAYVYILHSALMNSFHPAFLNQEFFMSLDFIRILVNIYTVFIMWLPYNFIKHPSCLTFRAQYSAGKHGPWSQADMDFLLCHPGDLPGESWYILSSKGCLERIMHMKHCTQLLAHRMLSIFSS